MKKYTYLPIALLIACLLTLSGLNLFISGSIFEDLQKVVLDKRTNYNSRALKQIGMSYLQEHPEITGADLGKYLDKIILDEHTSNFLIQHDSTQSYNLVWHRVEREHDIYSTMKTLPEMLAYMDKNYPEDAVDRKYFLHSLQNYRETTTQSLIVNDHTEKEYLLTWIIIPSPNPKKAEYIFYSMAPTLNILYDISNYEIKYQFLFFSMILCTLAMFVILPYTFNRITTWTSGKHSK